MFIMLLTDVNTYVLYVTELNVIHKGELTHQPIGINRIRKNPECSLKKHVQDLKINTWFVMNVIKSKLRLHILNYVKFIFSMIE